MSEQEHSSPLSSTIGTAVSIEGSGQKRKNPWLDPLYRERMIAARKRYIFTPSHKKNLSLAKLGHPTSGETRLKISNANKGRKMPEGFGEKMSLVLTGRKLSRQHAINMGLAHRGEVNGRWKGDGVGYSGLHYWVSRRLGKASRCDHCGLKTPPINKGISKNYFQWANIDHTYKRNLDDWTPLCPPCHKKYDTKLRALSGASRNN